MNRDPTVVGRAKVSAETFAEIINSFIEPISYKTMVRPLKLPSDVSDLLFTCSVWLSVFVQFCIWIVTTAGASSVCGISTGSAATDTGADAESRDDESLEWECAERESASAFEPLAEEDESETR
jgi:hypothetical protein